jgi:hypothetical protein
MLRKTLLLGATVSVMLLASPSYPMGMGTSGAGAGAAAGAGGGAGGGGAGGHRTDAVDPMRSTSAADAAERPHPCKTASGSQFWTTDPNCRPR